MNPWGWKPGERVARAVFAFVCFIAPAELVAGCWSDGAALQECKKTCLPLPVAKMSADGCVCFTGCPDWPGVDGGAR